MLADQDTWYQLNVLFENGDHFIRLTATPTRQRIIDKYVDEGAKVWTEEVPWQAVHPRARLGAMVCISRPPRKKGRRHA